MSSGSAAVLYAVFALGGTAVYLLFPKPGKSKAMAGGVLGLAAVAALIALLVFRVASTSSTAPYFCLFATIAIVAAARVITHERPVYSALYFVLLVVAVAALMLLLGAEFLAIALVIVYAGAIIVTYLFVIMLAQQGQSPTHDRWSREPFAAVLAGFVLMACVAGRAGDVSKPAVDRPVTLTSVQEAQQSTPLLEGNTAAVGMAIMNRYVVVLEIAGALLLIAMIGAISLSTKKVPLDVAFETPRPIGQIGKEVPPF